MYTERKKKRRPHPLSQSVNQSISTCVIDHYVDAKNKYHDVLTEKLRLMTDNECDKPIKKKKSGVSCQTVIVDDRKTVVMGRACYALLLLLCAPSLSSSLFLSPPLTFSALKLVPGHCYRCTLVVGLLGAS